MDKEADIEQFWLPDLCNGLALLRMILLGLLITLAIVVLRYGVTDIRLAQVGPVFLFALWIVLAVAAGFCTLRKFGQHLVLFWTVLIAIAWLLMVPGLCVLLLVWFGPYIWLSLSYPATTLWLESTLISGLLGAMLLRFFYVQAQLQIQEKQLSQTRFDLLQARIKPHFLFNSLNSIAALVMPKPDQAENALLNLSDLLRQTLVAQAHCTLAEELDICAKYMQLEKLRMADRLNYRAKLEPELADQVLPRLSLQPLLENAVIHGLQPLAEGGDIDLEVWIDGKDSNFFIISIVNPVAKADPDDAGSNAPKRAGAGIAQKNIRARLRAFFGPETHFEANQWGQEYCLYIRAKRHTDKSVVSI